LGEEQNIGMTLEIELELSGGFGAELSRNKRCLQPKMCLLEGALYNLIVGLFNKSL